MSKKNILVIMLLNLVTCGFYSKFWMYQIQNDFKKQNPELSQPNGLGAIVLSFLTCSFYDIYWYYLVGTNINLIYENNNVKSKISRNKYLIFYTLILISIILNAVISVIFSEDLILMLFINILGYVLYFMMILFPIIVQTDINMMIQYTNIEVEDIENKIIFK